MEQRRVAKGAAVGVFTALASAFRDVFEPDQKEEAAIVAKVPEFDRDVTFELGDDPKNSRVTVRSRR